MADQTQILDATIDNSTRLDRADWWTFGVTTTLTFLGYLLTLAPEVTLEFSGILTTSAMYGGVGPPAGNPAWTIYSWAFIKLLPFSNPAWRVAVGSAVAAAVSCGLVALMVSRSGKMLFAGNATSERLTTREQYWIRAMAGYAAGMALGFSDAFWCAALVADFLTFTILLFTVIAYLLMRWMETGRRRLCWLAFFIYGLLLTNSQEMFTALPGIVCAILLIDRKFGRDLCLFLIPVAALLASFTQYPIWDYGVVDKPLLEAFVVPVLIAIGIIIASKRFGSEWKTASACTLCFILGLALYLYLPIASATDPPVNWAYPRDPGGFIHAMRRGQYEHIQPTLSLSDFFPQLGGLMRQTGSEFGWPYLAFAIIPFCLLPRVSATSRKWIGVLTLIAICVGPLLVALLNAPSDRQSQELIELYFFPFRVLLAVWTGMGLMFLAMKTSTLGRP